MSKKHDESKDVKLVSRIAQVNTCDKTIQIPKSTCIGIRTLGRIDFLCHYCGYVFIYNDSIVIRSNKTDTTEIIRNKKERNKDKKDKVTNNKRKK